MKVVLFCGGLGLRLRGSSENVPKPMMPIGHHPILWHVMKYYAHFGHTDFILCLGYKADVIESYFLENPDCTTNAFVARDGVKTLTLRNQDCQDWRITLVDTGLNSSVGQRLKAVQPLLESEEFFLANYTDGLADIDLPRAIARLQNSNKIAAFASVVPKATFHVVETDDDDSVVSIEHIRMSGARINGGFFVLRREIFGYMNEGEELVEEPFHRLIVERRLLAYRHNGFWACMDTFKERQEFEDMFARGLTPWIVWGSVQKVLAKNEIAAHSGRISGGSAP